LLGYAAMVMWDKPANGGGTTLLYVISNEVATWWA
jgi:hypothetical protein